MNEKDQKNCSVHRDSNVGAVLGLATGKGMERCV